jgi:hypothetical protein
MISFLFLVSYLLRSFTVSFVEHAEAILQGNSTRDANQTDENFERDEQMHTDMGLEEAEEHVPIPFMKIHSRRNSKNQNTKKYKRLTKMTRSG